MRLNILAFAAGILTLQMQPELPGWVPWVVIGVVLVLPRLRWSGWPVRTMALLGCLALGVAWGTWRAETRLTDQLGADWEGRDIEVVGVVAALPQDFSNGTRFEFDVNFPLTAEAVIPQRIMLSWYQGRRDDEQLERRNVLMRWSGELVTPSSGRVTPFAIHLPDCCRKSATRGPVSWWHWSSATRRRFTGNCGQPSTGPGRRI